MSIHNHEGIIWSNAMQGVNRRSGPGEDYAAIDTFQAGQPLVVLCYSLGEPVTFTNPFQTNTSDAWDFVVTSDQILAGMWQTSSLTRAVTPPNSSESKAGVTSFNNASPRINQLASMEKQHQSRKRRHSHDTTTNTRNFKDGR